MSEVNKFEIDNFNTAKNYVVEASAGTGKTYNIVGIVEKLVKEKHEDLNKILIVTYTEKAAGELKDRIRTKLSSLPNVDVDNAPIFTIHSFSMNAIKEFGISAKIASSLSLVDDNEMDRFILEYVRSKHVLKKLSDLSDIFSRENSTLINEDILVKNLHAILNVYYLDSNYEEDESVITLAGENIKDVTDMYFFFHMAKDSEEILNKFSEVKRNYEILLHNTIEGKEGNNARKMAEELYQNKFCAFSRTYKKGTFHADELVMAFEFFDQLIKKGNYDNPSDLHIRDLKVLNYLPFIYAKDIYEKWQERKMINLSESFNDMIRYVREALIHNENFKKKLKEKYKRAIIDEFQDTNQLQFDIFKSIFLEDEDHQIMVVGDPKQSIYSFQGADVQAYFKAKNEIISKNGLLRSLNVNYRSTADMVTCCNELFKSYQFDGTIFEPSGFLKEGQNDKYHDVLYKGKPVEALWIASNPEKEMDDITEQKLGFLEDREDLVFSKIVAQTILDCCAKDENGKTNLQVKGKDETEFRNVTFKDFAILARARSEFIPFATALNKAGVPCLKYKDNSLFRGRECKNWVVLLQALVSVDFTGRNRSYFRKALFTDFFGRSLEEISSEYFDHDDSKEMELIQRWKGIAKDERWEDLMDDILDSSYLSNNKSSLSDLQSFGVYAQIADYMIDYLLLGHSLEDLIRQLNAKAKGESVDEDAESGEIIERNTNFDSVQMITYHSSKGLQYPVVIAISDGRKKIEKEVTRYKKGTNTYLGFSNNEVEIVEEMKRLFYVAYTRAQFVMVLPRYKDFKRDFLNESLQNYILNKNPYRALFDNHMEYKELRKIASSILISEGDSKDDSHLIEEQNQVLHSLIGTLPSKKTYKHSYSSLSHQEKEEEDVMDKEGHVSEGLSKYDKQGKVISCKYNPALSPLSFPEKFPKGTLLGSTLHEIFEVIDFQNYDSRFESVVKKCFIDQTLIYDGSYLDPIKDMVDSVLTADFPVIQGSKNFDSSFKLNSLSLLDKRAEVEFNFNLLNGQLKNFCNGFVDLIFKRGDYFSIIDWKSDSLNDDFTSYSDALSLKRHVDDAYSIQRVLYSYCLIQWLKNAYADLTEEEIFQQHFGGIYYVFLRGCNQNSGNGIYAKTWESYEQLKEAFDEICASKIGGKKA